MSEIPFAAEPRWFVRWRRTLADARWSIPAFLVGCALAGLVMGAIWFLGAHRPGYTVLEDLGATMDERGLASLFAADAFFTLLVGILGLAAGIVSWLLFRNTGWWVCLLAVLGSTIGAVVVWQFGLVLGGSGFSERLAGAGPGDVVPVDLALQAYAAILVAPFLAITPVMLFSAFWPEEGAPPTDIVATEGVAAD
ncbi:hypothetical protein FOJ82_12680 [Tessaracoccus rhinocerotis]|uniref:DUF2567 domain-containing protein n=1 Tax=Tessaracoccus rhinocerotis TaxID=1689449 RepID=A0A553JY58_9ACTN|nr:hypothetical protein [Tessaracoccus rhinocerotis]TRY17388.1 hypothetical protein FOJ82_12680 [Tessaracoccus rhinocerotis]